MIFKNFVSYCSLESYLREFLRPIFRMHSSRDDLHTPCVLGFSKSRAKSGILVYVIYRKSALRRQRARTAG